MLIPKDEKNLSVNSNQDLWYQWQLISGRDKDETNKHKITLGNNCGEIDAGEINSSLGNKSLGNDWGGVGNDYSKKILLTLTKISLQI